MKTEFYEMESYLKVVCHGDWTRDTVPGVLNSIREKALELSMNRILLDWFNVSAPETEFDRFLAGEEAARQITYPMKLAILYRTELINKFAENTAVNRGALLLVCDNEQQALEWLLS